MRDQKNPPRGYSNDTSLPTEVLMQQERNMLYTQLQHSYSRMLSWEALALRASADRFYGLVECLLRIQKTLSVMPPREPVFDIEEGLLSLQQEVKQLLTFVYTIHKKSEDLFRSTGLKDNQCREKKMQEEEREYRVKSCEDSPPQEGGPMPPRGTNETQAT